jgi:hypothetical protein
MKEGFERLELFERIEPGVPKAFAFAPGGLGRRSLAHVDNAGQL